MTSLPPLPASSGIRFLRITTGAILCTAAIVLAAVFPLYAGIPSSSIFDQEWRWIEFSTESGLPSNYIYNLVESPDGTPWVVTSGGIAWFDGYQWIPVPVSPQTVFSTLDGLTFLSPDSVLVTLNKRLYRGGRQGIFLDKIIYEGTEKDIIAAVPLHGNNCLLQVTTMGKHPLLSYDGAMLSPVPPPDSTYLYRCFTSRSGKIWLPSQRGLYFWNGKGWLLVKGDEVTGDMKILSLAESDDGSSIAYISGPITMRGLWEFGSDGSALFRHQERGEAVQALDRAHDGTSVVVYRSGIVQYCEKGAWQTLAVTPSPLKEVTFVRFRYNGDLWVGSEKGLKLYTRNSKRWMYWTWPFPNTRNTVHDIYKAGDGSIWAATLRGIEHYKLDGSVDTVNRFGDIPALGMTGVCQGTDGSIWVCGGLLTAGVYRWNGIKWKHYDQADGLKADGIHKIRRDREGRLWFLGLGKDMYGPNQPGAFVLENGGFRQWGPAQGMLGGRVYAFAEGPDSTLWFGTMSGLSRWRHGKWTTWDTVSCFAMTLDSNGHPWFCDRNSGIWAMDDNEHLRCYRPADGLPDNQVWDLAFARDGTLWFTTRSSGIGSYRNGIWSTFGKTTGLYNSTLWPLLLTDSLVYVGTDGSGIDILNLREEKNPPPRVECSDPAIDNDRMVLRWRTYSYWGEVHPSEIQCRYRLDDGDWSLWTTRRELRLDKLSFGTHSVHIQAKGLFGQFDSAGQECSFTIALPMYLRPAFGAPLTVLTFAVLYLAYALIARRSRYTKDLRDREARLQAITETTSSAIFIIHDLIIRFCNSSAVTLTGFGEEALTGKSLAELIHESDREGVLSKLKAVGSAHQVRITCEFRLLTQLAGIRWVECTLGEVGFGGQPSVLATIVDITDRKHAEEKLLAHQESLRSLTTELARSEERERRRMAAYLHDFIGQALAMCRLRLGSPGAPVTISELDQIRNYVELAARHTQSLTFDMSPPVLYELGFEDAIEWLTEEIEREHQLPVYLRIEGKRTAFDQDMRAFLFHVVRELLINIVKHAEAYSAKVLLNSTEREITITIQDDGKGFVPGAPDVHASRKGGFGLFNIRERLDHLGGSLTINSKPTQGTTVLLRMPISPPQSGLPGEIT
jgi:two-component system, NarL family, sensor histidine kinase UhpB